MMIDWGFQQFSTSMIMGERVVDFGSFRLFVDSFNAIFEANMKVEEMTMFWQAPQGFVFRVTTAQTFS